MSDNPKRWIGYKLLEPVGEHFGEPVAIHKDDYALTKQSKMTRVYIHPGALPRSTWTCVCWNWGIIVGGVQIKFTFTNLGMGK